MRHHHDEPSRHQLVEARDVFAELLSRRTKESDWQRFFMKYPYVLSTTLPLRLRPDHIIPRARPGRSEADFVFYPWDTEPVPFYGVIEIKRPDARIITRTRSNTAILTRDAETAVAQSKMYIADLKAELITADRSILCLGNQAYIFVIMGLQAELSQKLGEKLYREQIEDQLPRNLELLPYDTLFQRFDGSVPANILIVVPSFRQPDAAERPELDRLVERLQEEAEEASEYFRRQGCG